MTSDEEQTIGPSDETKQKFREALDRKNKASKQREGESHLDGSGAAQNTHGPVDHKVSTQFGGRIAAPARSRDHRFAAARILRLRLG